MKIAKNWKDYQIIEASNGEKLERWGDYFLLRPDPQIIWDLKVNLSSYKNLNAHYQRTSSGGGNWQIVKPLPESWIIKYKNLNFCVKPMGFKHTGVFPEQSVNWDKMIDLISQSKRKIKVLNLFAYTGGATIACASAGAEVCHVDSSKGMVERAKQNAMLSGLKNAPIRYIIDDCRKFVEREIRRGNFYDAIIMDPPSYGRGNNGEIWKCENDLFDFVKLCMKVLSKDAIFVLINSYTTGLAPSVLSNILKLTVPKNGGIYSDEIGLPIKDNLVLPCGASGWWIKEN